MRCIEKRFWCWLFIIFTILKDRNGIPYRFGIQRAKGLARLQVSCFAFSRDVAPIWTKIGNLRLANPQVFLEPSLLRGVLFDSRIVAECHR